jgi:protein-disulfide isomerase
MFRRIFAPMACALLFTLGCQAQVEGSKAPAASDPPAASGEGSTPVARIGDVTITLDELDEWIKNDLFDRQTAGRNPAKLFDVRRPALDQLIAQRVLDREAERRNLAVDEVIAAEVAALGEVSDEEVAQFYADQVDQMGGQTLEQIGPRIREYLGQVRTQSVAERLVENAGVTILLERPKVQVAADGPSKGPADAAVTIIEFSDFQCPFCSRAVPILDDLMKRYPNDVRIVYRHMPLDQIHPRSRAAAEASMCAEEQNGFWAFHDLLFANAKTLEDEDLKRFAAEANLDVPAWEECVSSGKFKSKVDADVEAARGIGVTGTPAFVINGVLLSGARPVEEFVPVIEAALKQEKEGESS